MIRKLLRTIFETDNDTVASVAKHSFGVSIRTGLALIWMITCIYLFNEYIAIIWGPNAVPVGKSETARDYAIALAAITTTPFIVWRAIVSYMQAVAAEKQAVSNERQVILSAEALSATTYLKAVELLGSYRSETIYDKDGVQSEVNVPNEESRIGAVFAVEGLFRANRIRWDVLSSTLGAYVRKYTVKADKGGSGVFRSDIQAALDVLGGRDKGGKTQGRRVDLTDVNLSEFDIDNKNFDNFDFTASHIPKNIYESSFVSAKINSDDMSTDFYSCSLDRLSIKCENKSQVGLNNCSMKGSIIDSDNTSSISIRNCDLSSAVIIKLNIGNALDLLKENRNGRNRSISQIKFDLPTHHPLMRIITMIESCRADKETRLSKELAESVFLLSGTEGVTMKEGWIDASIRDR